MKNTWLLILLVYTLLLSYFFFFFYYSIKLCYLTYDDRECVSSEDKLMMGINKFRYKN